MVMKGLVIACASRGCRNLVLEHREDTKDSVDPEMGELHREEVALGVI
jgi:hypothetical protein